MAAGARFLSAAASALALAFVAASGARCAGPAPQNAPELVQGHADAATADDARAADGSTVDDARSDAVAVVDAADAADAADAGVDAAEGEPDAGADVVGPTCVSGAPCTPGGNVCRTGTTSCGSGALTCAGGANVSDGTPCGTNEVCFNGACAPCAAGAACTPNGNACLTGTTSCATGQATCVPTGGVPDGTACSGGGLCCGGTCAACGAPPPNEAPTCAGVTCTFACKPGYTQCAGACVDPTSDRDACGVSCTVCPAGALCVNSQCTVAEYGNFVEYDPCGNAVGPFAPNVLLGQRVTIPALTVNSLGVIGNPFGSPPLLGIEGILALYSDVAGAPAALLARTAPSAIVARANVIPLLTPVTLPAGTYWIMGEYDSSAAICTDNATANVLDYVPVTYGTVPATLTAPTSVTSVDINYYLVGSP